jgi:methylmalonyl-CoA mutase cobalamin-binding subunit
MTDARRVWLAVVVAHLADVWSTAVALGLGGHESNPTAAAALGGGVVGLTLLKAGGLTAMAGVWSVARRRGLPATWVVPVIASVGGLVPAAWNTSQILLYGGVLA